MKFQEMQEMLNKHGNLTFKYKSQYYSLKKIGTYFHPSYILVDADNPPQQETLLATLYCKACLRDGAHLCEVEDSIELRRDDDSSCLSYEAVRHDVVVFNTEVHFLYNKKYYWIAHSNNENSYLRDEFGNTQKFNSRRDLFEYARIEGKSLKEIWSEVVVDAC